MTLQAVEHLISHLWTLEARHRVPCVLSCSDVTMNVPETATLCPRLLSTQARATAQGLSVGEGSSSREAVSVARS